MSDSRIPETYSKGPDFRLPAETQGFPTPESFSLPGKVKKEKHTSSIDTNTHGTIEKHALAGSTIKEVFHSLGHGLSPEIAATLANIGCASPALAHEVMRLGAALGGGPESQIRPGGTFGPSLKTPELLSSRAVLKGIVEPENISSLHLLFPLSIALALQEKGFNPKVSLRTEKAITSVIDFLKKPSKSINLEKLLKRLPPPPK